MAQTPVTPVKAYKPVASPEGEFSVFSSITKYLAAGDVASLSSWFADNLDLTVLSSSRNCSKAQALSRDQVKEKEGELILKHLSPADTLILLDEHGVEYRSTEFAGMLEKYMLQGTRNLVFAVGGAYGFSPEVHARARAKMALSKMTFTHQMVRTVFAEQLYRAFTILKGEPYHNE